MMLEQPTRAIMGRVRQFLVGGERQDDVAIGPEPLGDVTDEVGDENRRHGLVVDRAAAAEITVDLLQPEGIEIPVFGLRLYDVDMGNQQQRAQRAGSAQARDQVALARSGRQHADIGSRKAACAQPRRHGLGRPHRIAGGLRRVDLHQFPIDLPKELRIGRQRILRARGCDRRQEKQGRAERAVSTGGQHGIPAPL